MNKPKEVKFEDAIKRLEDIVDELETGEFDLDKAVEIFEEGVKLSKFCKTKLDEARQKIEVIKKSSAGGGSAPGNDIKNEKKEDYKKEKTEIGTLLGNGDKS